LDWRRRAKKQLKIVIVILQISDASTQLLDLYNNKEVL
jgi:ABC-type transporter Mla MlaB component